MRSSDRKMNEKLKTLLAVLIFIAAVIAFSMLLFYPYKKVWSGDNHYNILFLGASRVYKGIEPVIIDEQTGCNSYSLASDSCSLENRYILLQSALKQGTLEKVVLEVSYDALTDMYDNPENKYVFEVEPMSKLDGFAMKASFCSRKFNFWKDDYDNVYPALMNYGSGRWMQIIKGETEEKGYVPFGTIPQGMTAEEAAASRSWLGVNPDYHEDKKEYVNMIIELCLENNIEIILINTPDTETLVWQHTGWEVFEDYYRELSEKYGIKTYDFNLYKDRQSILNDDLHFNDYNHLSEDGADVFSVLLADIIKRSSSEDLSPLFYDSYEQAKDNSSYAAMLQ